MIVIALILGGLVALVCAPAVERVTRCRRLI